MVLVSISVVPFFKNYEDQEMSHKLDVNTFTLIEYCVLLNPLTQFAVYVTFLQHFCRLGEAADGSSTYQRCDDTLS